MDGPVISTFLMELTASNIRLRCVSMTPLGCPVVPDVKIMEQTAFSSTSSIWNLLGIAVTVIKIAIPIILIVFGMLDMGKAVTSGKEDEIKKSAMTFMRRAIAAIVIFFIPAIVGLVLSTIDQSYGSHKYCDCLDALQLARCNR